jgi:hypothetical protein
MAAAALAGLGGGIAIVGAHDVKYGQTIGHGTDTVTSPGDRYKIRGDVGSVAPNEKCDIDRTVKLFREQTGDDPKKGEDQTNDEGEFKFVFRNGLKVAMYYIKVTKRILKANENHRHVCRKGRTLSFAAGNNP